MTYAAKIIADSVDFDACNACGLQWTATGRGCLVCEPLRGASKGAEKVAEKVDHPAHYGGADNPFEPIKIIEHLGWGPAFCKGNALKYLMRAGKKSGESEAEDLAKARWYIDRAIEGLK